MTRRVRKCKCKHCREFFHPDPRSAGRQKFCSKPGCKKKSKADSQRRWLAKAENRDYFKGPDHVARVQQWRKRNPGYWRKARAAKNALQDSLTGKSKPNQQVAGHSPIDALQDVLKAQHAVFVGLIAQLTGSALQDDIAKAARRLRQLGDDVLNRNPQNTRRRRHDRL